MDKYDIAQARRQFLRQQQNALDAKQRHEEHMANVKAIQRRHLLERVVNKLQYYLSWQENPVADASAKGNGLGHSR